MGAHPPACTATMPGRFLPMKPMASSSANAFHMPIARYRRRSDRAGVRQLPGPRLLGESEPHGLLALDPVRLLPGRGRMAVASAIALILNACALAGSSADSLLSLAMNSSIARILKACASELLLPTAVHRAPELPRLHVVSKHVGWRLCST